MRLFLRASQSSLFPWRTTYWRTSALRLCSSTEQRSASESLIKFREVGQLALGLGKGILQMPNQIRGPLDSSHTLKELQSTISHVDRFHAGNDAVLRRDGPNHFVATGTHALSFGAGPQKLQSSLPLSNSTVAGVSFSTFVRLQATEHCCCRCP